jgi:coiled-coil domain-containing protein 130
MFIISLDTGEKPPDDPLAALEKSTGAQTHAEKVQAPRLEQLQDESERVNADPYTHSARIRKRFRAEKKIEQAAQAADEELRARYALPSEMPLIRDDTQSIQDAKDAWTRGRKERTIEAIKRRRTDSASSKTSGSGGVSESSALASLKARVLHNTARRSDPFGAITKSKPSKLERAAGVSLRKT